MNDHSYCLDSEHDAQSNYYHQHYAVRSPLSIPSRLSRKHVRRNDLVQHFHSCRMDHKPRIPFSARAADLWVELGYHRFILARASDQLQTVTHVQYQGY